MPEFVRDDPPSAPAPTPFDYRNRSWDPQRKEWVRAPADRPYIEITPREPPAPTFTRDAPADPLGSAPRFKRDEKQPDWLQPLRTMARPFTEYLPEVEKRGREGIESVRTGVQRMREGPGKTDRILGGLQTLGGAAEYVTAPVSAAAITFAGRPLQETTARYTGTSGIPEGLTGMAVEMALPGYGLAKWPGTTKTFDTAARIFSPDKVSPIAEESAASIRKFGGQAARDYEQTSAAVEQYRSVVNRLPDAERLDVMHYLEGQKATIPATLKPLADTLRTAFEARRAKLERLYPTMDFVDDYFPHMWKDPAKAKAYADEYARSGVSRQGSGASLKKRSVPTIAEGLARGLEPISTDPIEMALRYVQSMDHFIASQEILNAGKTSGVIRYFKPKFVGASGHPEPSVRSGGAGVQKPISKQSSPIPPEGIRPGTPEYADWQQAMGEGAASSEDIRASGMSRYFRGMASTEEYNAAVQAGLKRPANLNIPGGRPDPVKPASIIRFPEQRPPEGWVPIKGRSSVRGDGAQAYAPADWARVYNNYIDAGWHKNPDFGPVMDRMQRASNAITALELGLSGYHAFTMANEAFISQLSKGLSQAFTPGSRLRAVGTIPTAFAAPATSFMRGRKALEVYFGRTPGTPDMRRVMDLLTEAGGRAVGSRHAPDYQFSAMDNFWTAWKRGALKQEMGASVKSPGKFIGQAMSTVAHPLFNYYIPRLKTGAFYDHMKTFLDANPNATHEMQVAAARKIWDSIDNRFGEMVQDNIFWNKTLKQVSTLGMRSYSWNMGTIREIGGGALSAMRDPRRLSMTSPDYDPRVAYVMAMPMAVATMNAVYQYLMTGKAPESVEDLMAGRTGGTAPGFGGRGQVPERVMLPGYQKDVFGWYHDWLQEATNKMARLPALAVEIARNQDWRGSPIANLEAPGDVRLSQYMAHVADAFTPISVKTLLQGTKTGSNIGPMGQMMGERPAPPYLQDPVGYARGMSGVHRRAWRGKERYERKQQRQYGGDVNE